MINFKEAERSLRDDYGRLYMPFMRAMDEKFVHINKQVKLHYRYAIPDKPIAAILIMPGRAESAIKYAELCYQLYQLNYALVIYDHRGQGLSTRGTLDAHIGHVSRYQDFVEDALLVFNELLPTLLSEQYPWHLLAHSMGGAIASAALVKSESTFQSAALCAPMYGIQSPIPMYLAKLLAHGGLLAEKLKRINSAYFFGQGPYAPKLFAKNHLTNSELRYQLFVDTHQQDPRLQLGGISNRWLLEAMKLMAFIKAQASQITLDVCFLLAAQDTVVDNAAIYDVASKCHSAKLIEVPNARHEILFEKDQARSFAIEQILQFYQQSCNKS